MESNWFEVSVRSYKIVAEIVELVAENTFTVVIAQNLSIRDGRNRHSPVWYADYNFGEGLSEEDEEKTFLMILDPVHLEEVVKNPKWRWAMTEEIKSIEKNQTQNFEVLSARAKKIREKWIYKSKLNESGEFHKYKARLTIKGSHKSNEEIIRKCMHLWPE